MSEEEGLQQIGDWANAHLPAPQGERAAGERLLTIAKLQAAVEKAKAEYVVKKAGYRAVQDAVEEAAMAMEVAWGNLVMARWELARAQGVDSMDGCFQEPPQ